MTDAEQVACDALRMAGLGELADNLEFAREAVKARLEVLATMEEYCECGGGGRADTHNLDCPSVPLLSTQLGWLEAEHENAIESALWVERRRANTGRSLLGEWAQRQPGEFMGRAVYGNMPPQTAEGRLAMAQAGRLAMAQAVVQRLQREWDAIQSDLPDMPPK